MDLQDAIDDIAGLVWHRNDPAFNNAWKTIRAALAESTNSSHNTGSPKCEQCIHWNVEHGHHETECYSCKRYHVDMFTLRAGA